MSKLTNNSISVHLESDGSLCNKDFWQDHFAAKLAIADAAREYVREWDKNGPSLCRAKWHVLYALVRKLDREEG